jgi:hypothetical protein
MARMLAMVIRVALPNLTTSSFFCPINSYQVPVNLTHGGLPR